VAKTKKLTKEDKMTQSVIDFLNKKFPKKWYSIRELQTDFNVSRDTIYYWIEKFEVPTFKINNSPFVLKENLINFLLKSDRESYSQDRLVGFEFVVEDLERYKKLAEKIDRCFKTRARTGNK
jgi:IS30 family transposase